MYKSAFLRKKALAASVLAPLVVLLLSAFLLFVGSGPSRAQEADEQIGPTGLILLTPQEAELFRNTHKKVEGFAPNALALANVNKAQAKKGLPLLPEASAVPIGKEIKYSRTEAGGSAAYGDVVAWDNSTLPCFPPIGDQDNLGSCATFATTYYQLTHMVGRLQHPEWDQRINPPNYSIIFSPRWTYNFQRDAANGGSTFWDNYNVLQNNGACTWATFPYNGVDYSSWCTTPGPWREAINYRIDPISYITDDDLAPIKAALLNGYVLTFGTYVSSWQYTAIKDNPDAAEDDPYVGKNIAYWVKGTFGGHGMTIVGYNDAIWADVNRNRKIDTGELGAFRIANSWGTSETDDGFKWLAYDALKEVSNIPKAPSQGRVPAFVEHHVYLMSLKPAYTPKLVAVVTLSHAKRNQALVGLGISETTQSEPAISWYPGVFNFTGGEYAFEGTVALDFTDILLPENADKKYYLSVLDRQSGDPCLLKGFYLEDRPNHILVDSGLSPQNSRSVDAGSISVAVTCAFASGVSNYPPQASFTSSTTSGAPPLTVQFNGSGSQDPGGTIDSYIWSFGESASSPVLSGDNRAVTSHTYTSIGLFCAKLTVTDNLGASSSKIALISVGAQPGGKMHVSDIAMSAQKKGVNASATARVTIKDASGGAVSGATVYGNWSGATNETNVSGVTDSQGIATINSKAVKNPASWFTFTVTNVVKDGWTYDSQANVETSDSIAPPSAAPPKTIATALDLAYPDPGNPETWIPYSLAEPERVAITIYDARGRLIRRLDLGEKPAGVYREKNRAAYWDGRNEQSEEVSSGIYFYTMEAGSFRATGKTVILK